MILTFIYQTLIRCSFTSDPHYSDNNSGYEIRRVLENIRGLHSRWEFFSGRLELQREANNMRK